MEQIIGFCGYPDPLIIKEYKQLYPSAKWLDLDIDYNVEDYKILPQVYCKIVKNIVNNSIFYRDKIVHLILAVGKEKCDCALFASKILRDLGFNVTNSVYEKGYSPIDVKISKSNIPLREKFELITGSIIEKKDINPNEVEAKFGFWGVPPNDLSILDLFPNETHVFGWTRCVEAKSPYNLELEMYVEKNVPTVFYAQAFCAKTILAKYLSKKYNGLYVDIDDVATNSVRAKIEAFINLR